MKGGVGVHHASRLSDNPPISPFLSYTRLFCTNSSTCTCIYYHLVSERVHVAWHALVCARSLNDITPLPSPPPRLLVVCTSTLPATHHNGS